MSHIDDAEVDADADTDEIRSLEMRAVTDLFEEMEFPVTTEDVIAEFGDVEVSYPRESDPLRTILETSGFETYATPDDLRLAVFNGVRRDAVGRPRYSDRGDSPHDTDEFVRMQQSF
ncbi:hypothetical protein CHINAEXTREME_03690 [Halobiforma lacisalsi AJ5]|uniref:DUF2795 domain-containing protein n=1 Tax=Natronobacterium lacisalsi AJ5 TaxID=358396 RepID=M0LMA5_NATLA|nr:hypothetical protein [Halobiforma lacisalsi]APW96926.1 hypothetical protein CHINAEXTREME_03690 [Halobiforma lacisalsi AJ5]EMA34636.1 hypothetical protein C445_06930 [Halobiforma lacisalsi AJ5]